VGFLSFTDLARVDGWSGEGQVLIWCTIIYYHYAEHTDQLQLDGLQVAAYEDLPFARLVLCVFISPELYRCSGRCFSIFFLYVHLCWLTVFSINLNDIFFVVSSFYISSGRTWWKTCPLPNSGCLLLSCIVVGFT
jgi:hypothetical protein